MTIVNKYARIKLQKKKHTRKELIMPSQTFFSIIVPVYNVEKYLEKCLNSLVNQTYENYEIILINDGSKDHSREICEKFEKKYRNKIKLINQENKGLSAARNVGMSCAKGNYIFFIDSDDYIEINTLELLQTATNTNPDIIAFQNVVEGIPDNKNYHVKIDKQILSGQEYLSTCIDQTNLFVMVWRYVYSHEFIKKHQLSFHEGIIHEDEEWSFMVLTLAKSVYFMNEDFYHYVKRPNSVMTTKNLRSNRDYIQVAKTLDTFVRKINIEPMLKRKIKHRIFNFYYYNGKVIRNEKIVKENLYLLRNATNIKEWVKSILFLLHISNIK